MRLDRFVLAVGMVAYCADASNTAAAVFERRLIPIVAAGQAGVSGSSWSVRVFGVSEATPHELLGVKYFFPLPGVGRIPMQLAIPVSEEEPPGSIVYVPSRAAETIHLSAELFERSSAAQPVALPVVPEREFYASTRYHLGLLRTRDNRVMLRVYSLDLDTVQPAVRVRLQSEALPDLDGGWEFFYERDHLLSVEQKMMPDYEETMTVPVRPLALELPLDALLANVPEGAEFAVSVVPLNGLRIWSMLSETNPANHVTIRIDD
jgi:hypothetical protein